MENGKAFVPPKLTKVGHFPHHRMQPGDSWTFTGLSDEHLAEAMKIGVGGKFSRWFDTGESGRLFEITTVHVKERAVEAKFIGMMEFEAAPEAPTVEPLDLH